MKRPRRLSAAFVRTVNEPGRYGDGHGGHGLSLLVKPRTGWRVGKILVAKVVDSRSTRQHRVGWFPRGNAGSRA